MEICEIKGCENKATITVSRPTEEEERDEQVTEEGGLRWNYVVKRFVCVEHLELAQKEYPYIFNQEP